MTQNWLLSKKFTFEAAHKLPHHDGKCQRLHGHSWVGVVNVSNDRLITDGAKQGMVIDYSDIKKVLTPLVNEYLDHHYLNDSLGLESPTSEAVAQWLFTQLRDKLDGLQSVEIHETCTSRCVYSEPIDLSNAIALGRIN